MPAAGVSPKGCGDAAPTPVGHHGITWACVGIQEILPISYGAHPIFRGVIKGLTTSQNSVDNPVDTTVKAVEERLPDGL